MKTEFQTSNTKLLSLACSILVCACLFSILPISVSISEKRTQTEDVFKTKLFSAQTMFTQKEPQKISPTKAFVGIERFVTPQTRAPKIFERTDLSALEVPAQLGDFSASQTTMFQLENFAGNFSAELESFELAELDKVPSRLNSVLIKYPKDLLARGIEGEVRLLLTILEDGSVVVENIESSSDSRFNSHAVKIAQKLKYETPMKGGKPVRASFILPIPFKIVQ